MRSAEWTLAEKGSPPDDSELAALLAEARAPGEPGRRLAELQERLRQEAARLAAALAKVPLWERGAESLAALVPPTREMIERASGALGAATGALGEAKRDRDWLAREEADTLQRLEAARQGKPVPDAAAVAAARAHRHHGWSLIRRNKFEGEPLEAEIAAYGGAVGLAAAFERAVGDADDLTDRRDAESVRLATIAGLEDAVANLRNGIEQAELSVVEAGRRHREALDAWTSLTAGLGLSITPEPTDLQGFLAARDAGLDLRAARDSAKEAVVAEAAQQDAMRLRFARLMPEAESASLAEAIAAAQQAIERADAIRKERDRLEHELRTESSLLARAVEERNAAQLALDGWREEWRLCLDALKRPGNEPPAGVERAIEFIEAAHRERQRAVELDHRIDGMRKNIGQFAAQVADVVATAATDLDHRPPDAAGQELRRRLDAQREVLARRDQLLRQQKTARAKLGEAEARKRRAEAVGESVHSEVGGETDEEIPARINAAADRAQAEASLKHCERKLAEIGDGRTIAALDTEIAAIAADLLDSEFARLQLEFERLTQEREEAAAEEQRLAALRRIESGENALVAEESRQAAIASLTRVRDEALLYHAAACLLQAGLDRLRASEDSGLLRRIGHAFSRITGGAYCGVDADEDEKGAPFLVALEAGAARTKRVAQLSEGTRDQLFLALRLVMLEDYAHKAPAPPFIADDLLQTFDDYSRTANALAALADLSRHVQVIVLPHHRRLADAARGLPEGIISVCDLAA